jgi:hypothetical protein
MLAPPRLCECAPCCSLQQASQADALAGQVFQPRAAVDQQRLAEDAAQLVPDSQRVLVSPLVQNPGSLRYRRLNGTRDPRCGAGIGSVRSL